MDIAIIGAGVAGLAAARALHEQLPSAAVTIYEKSRGLGGRAATRRREGFIFDHGAQVFKALSPAVDLLLTQHLDSTLLRRVELPVWTFDAAGTIAEGDAAANAETSYCYADGNNRLGKLLAANLDVRYQQRVSSLRGGAPRWQLLDDQSNVVGEADLVMLTPPAPQIGDILAASDLALGVRSALTAELERARYRRCLSLALAYGRLVARPFYALLNRDRQHPVAWLALEHNKASERCPAGHSLLIAQMASQWSDDNYAESVEHLAPQVATLVGELLGEDLDVPLWADLQRWRFSQPDTGCDFTALNDLGAPHGLFFAGDFTAGRGRIHLAIEQGWLAAARMASRA